MYTYTYYSTVHGVLKARMMKWFVVPFSSGAHFVRTLHVALHGVLHSFIDSDKAVAHVISLISFLWLRFSFCLPSDGEGLRGLWKLPDGRDWLWEKQIKLPTSIRSLKKQESSRKNIYFCFIDYAKAFDCVDHNQLQKILRDGNTRPPNLPLEKSVCRSGSSS